MQKITVVTVARNVCQALRQTMDSVLQQDYENVEYIVVDGASTDGTVSMLESVDCPYLKWISEPDSGIYNAMNKAIGMATGEYVIFMNAGDLFASDDVLSRVFEKPEQADIIYGHVEKKDKQGVWQVKKAEQPHNSHRMFFCHQSCFVRRELLQRYCFDERYRYSADFKLIKTLFLAGHTFVLKDVVVARFDTNGVSNTRRSEGLADNIKVVRDVDNMKERLRLLPRLYFVYLMCRWRERNRNNKNDK